MLFIGDASKRLFKEKIAGNVPESLFKNMLADYESELSELEKKAADIEWRIQEDASSTSDVLQWMELIKGCVSVDRLYMPRGFELKSTPGNAKNPL